MSAFLRSPHQIPSLFSTGVDQDDAAPRPAPLGGRLAASFAGLQTFLYQDADRAVARYAPALMASSLALLVIGKPLLKAASLAVGVIATY